MLYSLSATNHSAAELDNVQQKAIQRFLPCMGYERSFPRAVVFAPISFGGLGIGHLYVDGQFQKISTMMSHLRANTELGIQIRITLDWTQLVAGISTPILESKTNLDYVENNWFIMIQKFLKEIDGSLKINNLWLPTLEQRNDLIIMDEVHKLNLSPTQLKIFNNWRLYFRVLSLAEILTERGDQINPFFLKYPSTRDNPRCSSKINWPRQGRPHNKYFSIWKQTIALLLSRRCSSSSRRDSINSWSTTPQESRLQWTSYYSPHYNRMYKIIEETAYYQTYIMHTTIRSNIIFKPTSITDTMHEDLPGDSVPIAERSLPNNMSQTNIRHILASTHRMPHNQDGNEIIYTDFHQFMMARPSWQQHLLRQWKGDAHPELKLLLSSSQPLLIASDGGYYNGIGSFGVVIGDTSSIFLQMNGDAPGPFTSHSSFRSECYGILGAVNLLILHYNFEKIQWTPNKTIQLYCDNEGLILRLTKHLSVPMSPAEYLLTDSDVELQILESIKELQSTGARVKLFHIRGHQDDNIAFEQLCRPAQLNVLADRLASKRLSKSIVQPYYELPASAVTLTITKQVVTSNFKFFIRNAYLTPNLRSYMIAKFQWSDDIPDKIWWQPHGMAMRTLHNPQATRIKKWIFNHLPTSKRQSLINKCGEATCQMCNIEEEDDDHILRCSCDSRTSIRGRWLEELYHYLDSTSRTPKEVTRCIMRGVTNWLLNKPPSDINRISYIASTTLQEAYNEQTNIGWDQFLRGRISMKWSDMIRYSYYHINKVKPHDPHKKQKYYTPESWAKGLIKLNWEFVNSLWEDRITYMQLKEDNMIKHDNHYFLLLRAYRELEHHNITNQQDKDWLLKSNEALNTMSSNQLKLWLHNMSLIKIINNIEHEQGP